MRPMETPMRAAVSRSWNVARIARPSFVFWIRSQAAAMSPAARTRTKRRSGAIATGPSTSGAVGNGCGIDFATPPSRGARRSAGAGGAPPSARALFLREKVRQRHLAVADLDDEDARLALAALLAGGTVLLELDRAVDAHQAHAPEGLAHGLGIVLAGDPDRLGDRGDPVVASEALREPLQGMAALGPLVDERLGELAVGHRLREPRHEEDDVIAALRGGAGLLDELRGRRAPAGRDDLAAEPLLLRLLHHERDLLDGGRQEEPVAARRLDPCDLRVPVGR